MGGKMVNKRLILICISIMILLSSYCTKKTGQQSADESKITVLSIGDERVLGPYYSSPPRFLVFLPLVEESHDEPKPALAERWEHSPDYKIWTFYLRKDVRWHDGVTTTAHDIKFSLDLMDEVVQFKQMQGIASYEVIDDFTFAITYKKPSIYSLDYWSVYWPKHLLEDLDTKEFWKWDFWTQPVGNGPYRYVRHVPKTMIELEANQDYYKGKPKIRKVILKFGEGAPLTELLSGNVDVIQAFPSDVPKLRDDPRFHVYYKRTWHVGAIFWNHRHSLFRESSIRRALTMAINRRELARLLYYPDDISLFDGISTTFQYFNDDLPEPLPYDTQRAEQLLEEEGWYDRDGNGVREKGNQEFRFTAIVDTSIKLDLDKAAVFVQDQLKRVGIRMDIQPIQQAMNTRFRSGDFEALFGKFLYSPIAGSGHLSILGENSPIGYENVEMIRLLKQAKNEPDLEKSKQIFQKIMPLYTADIPMTILFPETRTLIAHKRVRGLEEYSDPTWFMEYLWIEEGKK
jgi:peptide/nickel transport system substrate-binding protein